MRVVVVQHLVYSGSRTDRDVMQSVHIDVCTVGLQDVSRRIAATLVEEQDEE